MINGIATVHYGVEDVETSIRFLSDFGLPLAEREDGYARFEMAEGSAVTVRKLGDPALPKSALDGIGVQEVVWGVSTERALERLHKDLSKDHDVRVDQDGTLHIVTAFGLAMGFSYFRPLAVTSSVSPSNAPGNINRVNQWRKWRKRACPKTIEHIVYNFPDVNAALDFMRGRLGFRVTDVQLGVGVYLRAPGASGHHTIALTDAEAPFLHSSGRLTFGHVNFGVEDIDEIMVGKMYMERLGWPPSEIGLGRHRIGSGAFLYVPSPLGGEIEYGADIDRVDDSWVPHIWSLQFGYLLYGHNLPPHLNTEQTWELEFVEDPATVRHIPFPEFVASRQASDKK